MGGGGGGGGVGGGGERGASEGTEKPSQKHLMILILYFQIISLLVSMTTIKWTGLLHKILTFH